MKDKISRNAEQYFHWQDVFSYFNAERLTDGYWNAYWLDGRFLVVQVQMYWWYWVDTQNLKRGKEHAQLRDCVFDILQVQRRLF